MDWIDCEVCGVKIPKEENANKKHLVGLVFFYLKLYFQEVVFRKARST